MSRMIEIIPGVEMDKDMLKCFCIFTGAWLLYKQPSEIRTMAMQALVAILNDSIKQSGAELGTRQEPPITTA